MDLAGRLHKLRIDRKQSLQDVADAVGISKAHVWELEKARSKNPSFELMQKLAGHFGVSFDAVTGATEIQNEGSMHIERIHRDLKHLSDRDRDIVEGTEHQ